MALPFANLCKDIERCSKQCAGALTSIFIKLKKETLIFTEDDEDRLDFQLLWHGACNLYREEKILDTDLDWLLLKSYKILDFHSSNWLTLEGFLQDFGTKVELPSYVRAIEGVPDALTAMDIPSEGGVVLIFRKFDLFFQRFEKESASIIEYIENASRDWLLYGRRLICLLQMANSTQNLKSLCSRPITWNPKERLKQPSDPKSRNDEENGRIELRVSPDDSKVAYLTLPGHPGESAPGCVKRTIQLADVINDYRGANVQMDFDSNGNLIGIEILE